MGNGVILINRARVLTLWAVVVAERFGDDCETALSLGKAPGGAQRSIQRWRLG